MLFLTLCSSFGSLWGSIFAPFWHHWVTIWSTRGFPGRLRAHLLGCSEPQGPKCMQKVVSQPQRCHFWGPFLHICCNSFNKKGVCGECWLAGRFFCSFSWFSGSLDPPSAAACAVQSQFSIFGVTLENVSFLHTFR